MRGRTLQVGLLAAMAALLAVAGCAPHMPGAPKPPPGQPPIADTSWVLEAYGEPGSLVAVLPNTEPTLAFVGTSEVSGDASCNSYGGTYSSQLDGSVEFAELYHTEMYCVEPGVMEQEETFLSALRLAQRYEYVNAELHISGGGKLLVFSRS